MSSKYKFTDREGVYFVTATVVDWVDVFTGDIYRDILLESFRFCQAKQRLHVHAWVLMPNPRLTGRAGLSHDMLVQRK